LLDLWLDWERSVLWNIEWIQYLWNTWRNTQIASPQEHWPERKRKRIETIFGDRNSAFQFIVFSIVLTVICDLEYPEDLEIPIFELNVRPGGDGHW